MAENSRLAELAALTRSVAKLPETTLITSGTRFVDDLGIDSLDLVALFLDVQDRFDVTIDEDRIGSIRTVGDLLALIGDGVDGLAA
jgi:acyl carrier protein